MVQLTLQEAMARANAHLRGGRVAEAVALLRQILTVQPGHPGVLVSMGIALHSAGQVGESVATFEELTRLQPNWPDGWNNLGVVLRDTGRRGEAVAAFERALKLKPDFPAALDNLGAVLQDLDRLQEALRLHRRAIALRPTCAISYNNLANALKFSGRIDESIAAYRQSLEHAPDDPVVHHFLGLALLLAGEHKTGWIEHEWRCRITRPARVCRDFPQPRWNGEPLGGRTILLHAEQGLGDTIQFSRYVPHVAAGGKVIVLCQPELVRLLRESLNVEQVAGETDPLPGFDVHCPLMSLPLVLGMTPGTMPAPPKYLMPDPSRVARWKARLVGAGEGINIGIAWAGKRSYTEDRRRSVALSMLRPLAGLQGVRLISLQKGLAAVEAREAGFGVIDWTKELEDFSDTAALIEALDGVVSVDTAVAHLAGALGRPVGLLLPFVPDWRWRMNGDDSPWYPTARLFRQPVAGDWATPIEQATRAVRQLASENTLL